MAGSEEHCESRMPENSGHLIFNRRLAFAIYNAASLEVVGRDFHHDAVTGHNPDEVLTHFAGYVSHYLMSVFEFHAELRIRERLDHVAFDLNCFFLRHSEFFFRPYLQV